MIGERTKEDLEHSQDIDLMAGGLGAILSENEQTATAGVAIYVQHPAMDVPGTAKVIDRANRVQTRSEDHTSEPQSLMRISYAVFCLKQQTHTLHCMQQVNRTYI